MPAWAIFASWQILYTTFPLLLSFWSLWMYDFHSPPSFPLPSWLMNTPPHAALQIWLYSWSRPRWNSAELLLLAGTGTVPCHCGPATATIKGENEVGGGTGGWDGDKEDTDGGRWFGGIYLFPPQNVWISEHHKTLVLQSCSAVGLCKEKNWLHLKLIVIRDYLIWRFVIDVAFNYI